VRKYERERERERDVESSVEHLVVMTTNYRCTCISAANVRAGAEGKRQEADGRSIGEHVENACHFRCASNPTKHREAKARLETASVKSRALPRSNKTRTSKKKLFVVLIHIDTDACGSRYDE
jgi:hypothetical protein